VPDQDVDTIGRELEGLLRGAAPDGAELDVRWEGTPPGVLPTDEGVQRAALEALERAFGRRPLLVRSGGTLPIVPALADAGIPSLLVGMATPDCNTHSPNERLPLEALDVGVRAARELYVALGEL
jgi:acetylornithine deacetylase/succinyl-diaminopimelate desuccinylase-like protein